MRRRRRGGQLAWCKVWKVGAAGRACISPARAVGERAQDVRQTGIPAEPREKPGVRVLAGAPADVAAHAQSGEREIVERNGTVGGHTGLDATGSAANQASSVSLPEGGR